MVCALYKAVFYQRFSRRRVSRGGKGYVLDAQVEYIVRDGFSEYIRFKGSEPSITKNRHQIRTIH